MYNIAFIPLIKAFRLDKHVQINIFLKYSGKLEKSSLYLKHTYQ